MSGPFTVLLKAESLDPRGMSALSDFVIDDRGRMIAVGIIDRGSDWRTWRIVDTATGRILPDALTRMKLGVPVWSPGGRGLYYTRLPDDGSRASEEGRNQELAYHEIGTPAELDEVLLRDEQKKGLRFTPTVTADGRLLVVTASEAVGGGHRLLTLPLGLRGVSFRAVVEGFDDEFTFVGTRGDEVWFKTTHNAHRGRIIAISRSRPSPRSWKEVVPERSDTLARVTPVGKGLAAVYLQDGVARLRILDARGRPLRTVELPSPGAVLGLRGRSDRSSFFVSYATPAMPATLLRVDALTGTTEIVHQPKLPKAPGDFESVTELVPGRGDVSVPVTRSALRGNLHKALPTLLTGYGGFGRNVGPGFSTLAWTWITMGGVFAVASVRGGGEFGEGWHRAGMRRQKQRVFDDFIAVAEWLVANGYTSPDKLGIAGSSNGGLLVAACAQQRPDLFGAVLPDVGVFDMLRFHRLAVGWQWVSEYGTPEDPQDFRALRAYSPYHNVGAGARWPPTLVTAGGNDDRVSAAHSFKFVAALQTASDGTSPILLRVADGVGHGAGKSRSQRESETVDRLAFLAQALGLHPDKELSVSTEDMLSSSATMATDGGTAQFDAMTGEEQRALRTSVGDDSESETGTQ